MVEKFSSSQVCIVVYYHRNILLISIYLPNVSKANNYYTQNILIIIVYTIEANNNIKMLS